jgi:hypothetical protein
MDKMTTKTKVAEYEIRVTWEDGSVERKVLRDEHVQRFLEGVRWAFGLPNMPVQSFLVVPVESEDLDGQVR